MDPMGWSAMFSCFFSEFFFFLKLMFGSDKLSLGKVRMADGRIAKPFMIVMAAGSV